MRGVLVLAMVVGVATSGGALADQEEKVRRIDELQGRIAAAEGAELPPESARCIPPQSVTRPPVSQLGT